MLTMLFETTPIRQILVSVASVLLMSLALWKLLKKLHWEKAWMGWIPGLRMIAYGSALDMDREGILCGILEIILFFDTFWIPEDPTARGAVLIVLILLVLTVIFIIYRIRMFFRLATALGAKKIWLLSCVIAEWFPFMVFAFSSRFQPQQISFTEEWKAGTTPAAVPSALGGHPAAESGLSVDLKERSVTDYFKKRYLLKDISLDIPNGSLVLLLGGSGSGKTTFINAVIGYEKANARVMLNGGDVYKDYDRMKYRIGYVPQKNLIRGNDTVIRTVDDAAELRLPAKMKNAERNRRVTEVMDLLGLTAGKEGLVSKKSGGQLRRISIAQELVMNPELFVLDEPDSGLDGVIAREIFSKLRTVADEGKIVIVITHTPDRVIDLFDKVIVLARDSGRVGRLAFYGSPQEAREFFGKSTMEDIVMSVNRKEEGGEGLADTYIERYATMKAEKEGDKV